MAVPAGTKEQSLSSVVGSALKPSQKTVSARRTWVTGLSWGSGKGSSTIDCTLWVNVVLPVSSSVSIFIDASFM